MTIASARIIPLPLRTYRAKQFEVRTQLGTFLVSGTLDGFIDFYVPAGGGTLPLTPHDVQLLLAALSGALSDVAAHCLHDRDALLVKPK